MQAALPMLAKGKRSPGAEGAAPAVGRRVESNQADDRRVIRLVRERPLLYTRNNMPVASYYSQVKLLWQEIASEMGWSVAEVRRKWSHIRNSYSRHLRNELHGALTGRGRVVSKWYLADELHFLRDHMATDVRPSPYSAYASSFLDLEVGEPAPPEPLDVKPFLGGAWLGLAAGGAHAHEHAHAHPDAAHAHSEDSSGSQAEEHSVYFQFFKGIYGDYQELSSRKQRQFRRQCLQLLHGLLDEEECGEGEAEAGRGGAGDGLDTAGGSPRADPAAAQDLILPN